MHTLDLFHVYIARLVVEVLRPCGRGLRTMSERSAASARALVTALWPRGPILRVTWFWCIAEDKAHPPGPDLMLSGDGRWGRLAQSVHVDTWSISGASV